MRTIIEVALRFRFLVLSLTVLLAVGGIYALKQLPIDAVPDITSVQVQVLTKSPSLAPLEVEQFITFPVESAMTGIPRVHEIRSVSRYGLSAVTVIFDDGTDLYRARQLVAERLNSAIENIPPGFGRPEMGPMTTGLSEVYMFTLEGPGYTPMQLRTILDWDVAYRLRSVPGIVEMNTWGGQAKQYQVVVEPAKLVAYKVSLQDVFRALESNNANVGSGYIEKNQQQYIIRGEALAKSLTDLENVIVATRQDGVPIYVRTIAEVREGAMLRIGAASANGQERVIGMAMMLAGENADEVGKRVRVKVAEIEKSLPPGVKVVPFYDRADFVDRVLQTVRNNLLEGGLLVVAVLLLLLGNVRGGLIVAAAIPLSMLFAFIGMLASGISGNLMSLGAIDFGIIVDGAVVMIENISRHLGEPGAGKASKLDIVRRSAIEVVRPVTFAVAIITLVYFPILSLTGIEGKMFRPMAATVIFALAGSLLLAVTVMPVLGSFFLKSDAEREPWLMRRARKWYEAALDWHMARPRAVATGAAVIFLVSILVFAFLGSEFIPRLDEGDITIQAWRLPSISMTESINSSMAIERTLRQQFPEVKSVVSRTGSPEVATDVMGIELSDIFVVLKPRSEWQTAHTKEELIAKMNAVLQGQVPGVGLSFTQPIEMRFNELIAGSRSDIAVKLFGDDLNVLQQKGAALAGILGKVPGAADVRVEQTAGLPVIRVAIDRNKLARYGLNAEQVLDTIQATRAGKVVGTILEGRRRFELTVRMPDQIASDAKTLGNLPIAGPGREIIPLAQVADVIEETGPAQVSREDVQRRLTVEVNVRGRDIGGFVQDAQNRVAAALQLPPGYYVVWGGQFEQLQAARTRLLIVVPLTMALIFLLLYTAFGAVRPAVLIFLNVPLAITGGVFALAVRGMPFSISAGVGFIALFGVAVLNGVVLVSYINQLRQEGKPLEEAVREGAKTRLRPVLMTAMVASHSCYWRPDHFHIAYPSGATYALQMV
jgi:cobalt-zinc-cadmium resistance protein CzcA